MPENFMMTVHTTVFEFMLKAPVTPIISFSIKIPSVYPCDLPGTFSFVGGGGAANCFNRLW